MLTSPKITGCLMKKGNFVATSESMACNLSLTYAIAGTYSLPQAAAGFAQEKTPALQWPLFQVGQVCWLLFQLEAPYVNTVLYQRVNIIAQQNARTPTESMPFEEVRHLPIPPKEQNLPKVVFQPSVFKV